VELSAAQITAKVEKDPVEWNARIEALRNVALEALDVAKRKDVNELWDVGENLENACESCHRSYWYPGEGPEFYRKLERRLQEFRQQKR
jgi:cytochrome c556